MPVTTRNAWKEEIASNEPTAENPNSIRPSRRAKTAAAVKKEVHSEDDITGSPSPTPSPPSSSEYERGDTPEPEPEPEPQTTPRLRYDTITPPTISPLSSIMARFTSPSPESRENEENHERGLSPTPSPPPPPAARRTTSAATAAAGTTTAGTTAGTSAAAAALPYFVPFFLRPDFVPQPPVTGKEAWAANRVWNTDSKKWDVIDDDKLAKIEDKFREKAEKKRAK